MTIGSHVTSFNDEPEDDVVDDIADSGELPDDVAEEADLLAPADDLSAEDVSDMVSYTLDWSVQSLLERIGTTFNINPAFQRRDAWGRDRKSLYIESLMLGLPVPQVVLAEDKDRRGSFLVLDGKQRLVTMKQFAAPDDKFPALRLRRMQFLSQLDNRTFADIRESLTDSEYVENLLAQPVRTIVLPNWQRPAVLYQVFLRLNQNSVSLSPQELRQALFPGDFTTWINERSARSADIHRARRIKKEDFRMRDAEMLLRAIAWHDRLAEYGGNLRSFLDDQCRIGLRDWAARQDEYESMAKGVEVAIRRTEAVFQGDAFLRWQNERYIPRFNIAVYDMMTTIFSSPVITEELLMGKEVRLRSSFEFLCRENDRFAQSLATTTKTTSATGYRVAAYSKAVEEALGVTLPVREVAEQLVARGTAK